MSSLDKHRVPGSVDKHLPDIRGDSFNAKDLDIADSDLFATDDFVGYPSAGGGSADSITSSSSYSDAATGEVDLNFPFDTFFSGKQGQAVMVVLVNANGDQIDVRLRNKSDGETVVEKTGITGTGNKYFTIGPSNYTPTTTASPVRYRVQIRNSDNATSVSLKDVFVQFGVGL